MSKNRYKYSDYRLWAKQAFSIQEMKKKYITCAEAAQRWGISSRSAAQDRLEFLVSVGMAERVFEGKWHYHIIEVK